MSEKEIPQNPFYEEYTKTPEEKEAFKYDHELGFIGDTNGDFLGFLKNLLSLGYVDIRIGNELLNIYSVVDESVIDIMEYAEFSWKAGNAHLVLLGDILGDRRGEGDKILKVLDILKKLARQNGGDVVALFGNHDASALRYLVYGQTQGVITMSPCPLDEYLYFSQEIEDPEAAARGIKYKKPAVPNIFFNRDEMYKDKKFIEHLRQIRDLYKIVHVENETLFVHSDIYPPAFIRFCTAYRGSFDQMNVYFKKNLDALFPEINGEESLLFENERNALAEEFFRPDGLLDTMAGLFSRPGSLSQERVLGHREEGVFESEYKEYPSSFIAFLQGLGITRVVFGHTQHTLQVYDDFQVISADGRSTYLNDNFSAGRIGKDGTLQYNVTPRSRMDAQREAEEIERRKRMNKKT